MKFISCVIFGLSLLVSACSQNSVYSRNYADSPNEFLADLNSSAERGQSRFSAYWERELQEARIEDRVRSAMGGIATSELATAMAATMSKNSDITGFIKEGLEGSGWESHTPKDAPNGKLYSFEYKDGAINAFRFDKENDTKTSINIESAIRANGINPDSGTTDVIQPIPREPIKRFGSKYRTARAIVTKPGYVFNPWTNRAVDVRGIPNGTLIRDPNDGNPDHKFRVP